MAKINTRKYLIYGSIATIVGVLAYLIWKGSKKDNKPKNDFTPQPDNDNQFKDQTIKDQNKGGGVGGNTPAPTEDRPLKSENAIRKFQYYVINTKGDKTILGSGGESGYGDDGQWGSKTKAAWDKYGADYKKSLSGGGSSSTTTQATQAQTNKQMMDKLQFALTGNSAVTPLSDASGRIIRVNFYTTWKGEDMRIVFFEMKSGKKPAYYYIKNDKDKVVKEGFWTFDGTTYDFKGTKAKGTKLLDCIKTLVGVNVAYGES